MAKNSKPVTIKTHNVGQNFGCCATVHANGEQIYETETYAFGCGSVAFANAEQWADHNGFLTQRGIDALASAITEYNRTVSAAMRHTAADGRQILTSEHCGLMSAIQAFEQHLGFEALEKSTAECRRTRELWSKDASSHN